MNTSFVYETEQVHPFSIPDGKTQPAKGIKSYARKWRVVEPGFGPRTVRLHVQQGHRSKLEP